VALKAVFLDKDGTLVENVPFNADPDRIRLLPGTREGLELLHALGYELIVLSNQPGVALGYFTESELDEVERRLQELIGEIPLAGFYYCPHGPEEGCPCRKPSPGLVLRAARERGLETERCWMIGDILNDVEAGRKAGCRSILLDTGGETEWKLSPERTPDYVALSLDEAARWILSREETP
jgi:D-glycero-D-manno-heptose 1,7-bisphosphate phosphatase